MSSAKESNRYYPIEPNNYTVLVVDDTTTNLQVITDYLNNVGFRVLAARNGDSGLQRAQHGQPDIILLDVLMPGIDGFETCRRLKQDPRTRDIPVIFMTALDETKDKVRGFEMGAVDYVTKPIQQEEILARVQTHLSIRDLTQQLEQRVQERTLELEQSLLREQALAAELRKALEKETELNHLKSKIIEVVSHEFRTPLSIISQAADLLKMFFDRLTEEKRERQFAKISESVTFVDKLISDISRVNSFDVTTPQAEFVSTSLKEVGTGILEALEQTVVDIGRVQLTFEPDNTLFDFDAMAFRDIALELCNNSLKFSANAPVKLHLLRRTSHIELIVSDQGIGIPDGDKEHIFDAFFRASNVEARRGLGLGLYIVNRLIEANNGRIRVDSDKSGTRFTVLMPLVRLQAHHPTATGNVPASPEYAS